MNLYIDTEWFLNQNIFLIGYKFGKYRVGTISNPTRADVLRLLRRKHKYIFVYGPDIKMLEKAFNLNIRKNHFCVNSLKLAKHYLRHKKYSLSYLEKIYKIDRRQKKYKENIFQMFVDWEIDWKRKYIISYNKQDVRTLAFLTDKILRENKVDLKKFRL